MPPQPKSKKGGPNEEQMQTTVKIVKQYWPKYDISTTNIRNPTRDFMLKFYTDCANDLDAKCAFVTRSEPVPPPPGLCEEEILFLKLSKVHSLLDADFKVGDLFAFDPKRVNTHMFIIMHFLIFTDTVTEKMVDICNSVFNTKETIRQNEEELEQLKEEKTQTQISLTLAKSENKKLKQTATSISPCYEETLALVEESEKKCKQLIAKLNKLEVERESIRETVEKLQKVKEQLQNQIVTEEEFNNLKSTLESHKKEEQNLEEIDMSNGLFEQKQHIEQLQRCLQELQHLDLPEDLLNLSRLRVEMINEQQNYGILEAHLQNNETDMKELQTQLETQIQLTEAENLKLQETLKKTTEEVMLEKLQLKKKHQQVARTLLNQIEEIKRCIKLIEEDSERMRKDLEQKYRRICEFNENQLEKCERVLL